MRTALYPCLECGTASVLDARLEDGLVGRLCRPCAKRRAVLVAAERTAATDLSPNRRDLTPHRDRLGVFGELLFAVRYRPKGVVVDLRLRRVGDGGWDFNVGGVLYDVKATPERFDNLLVPWDEHAKRVGLRADVYVLAKVRVDEPLWPARCWCRRAVIESTPVTYPPERNLKWPARVITPGYLATLEALDDLVTARSAPARLPFADEIKW
jgi:hypothetical protein